MNNRGQIYIIAALILSAIIFLLISQTNFIQRILIEDDFEQISKNFDIESTKFVNNLLAEDTSPEEVESKFRTFTEKFSDYAKIENPNFEFLYVLGYRGEKIVGYYIKEDIYVGPPTKELEATVLTPGSYTFMDMGISQNPVGASEIEPVGDISWVEIEGFSYDLKLGAGPQLIIISREKKGEQTKVYLNEEFIKGRKSGG